MSSTEVKQSDFTVVLHGFYDYRECLLDDKVSNGAVAYNDKFSELIIKINSEWYFLENSDKARPVEQNLFKHLNDLARGKDSTDALVLQKLNQITVEFNLVEKSGTTNANIIAFSVSGNNNVQIKPKASKEVYLENEDFGEF